MRSSMALTLRARRSISSPVPATGSRPDRLPAMMVCDFSVIASTRRRIRRLTKKPPPSPSTSTAAIDQRPAVLMMS